LEGLFRQIKISAKGKIALDNSHGANLIGAVRGQSQLFDNETTPFDEVQYLT